MEKMDLVSATGCYIEMTDRDEREATLPAGIRSAIEVLRTTFIM